MFICMRDKMYFLHEDKPAKEVAKAPMVSLGNDSFGLFVKAGSNVRTVPSIVSLLQCAPLKKIGHHK